MTWQIALENRPLCAVNLWQRKAHTVRQVEADQVGIEKTVEVERNN